MSPSRENDTITVERDVTTAGEECWVARDLDRPGCFGYGETEEEALADLERGQRAYDATDDIAATTASSPSVVGEIHWDVPAEDQSESGAVVHDGLEAYG